MKLLIILLIPINLFAYTTNEWIGLYLRECTPSMHACKGNLEKDLGKMLAYSNLTFKYLDKHDLPRWLATIPIIESGYNEKAVSPKFATGLWQLMPYLIERHKTRKITILGRNLIIVPSDKQIRKYGFNPVVSTQIATAHLRYLFEKYSGHKETEKLVLMAYNAGERRVNLWYDGKGQLPQETVDYYNKIMAVQYILKNMELLNVKPVAYKKIFILDYIKALTSMDTGIERDYGVEIVQRVLG
jgi:transglycosylase-like protein with SLT domain